MNASRTPEAENARLDEFARFAENLIERNPHGDPRRKSWHKKTVVQLLVLAATPVDRRPECNPSKDPRQALETVAAGQEITGHSGTGEGAPCLR
jgi:hypothetical protein